MVSPRPKAANLKLKTYNSERITERHMAQTKLTYNQQITALLVIDPYNDFISEGGKIWDRIKGVAEANHCVPNMVLVLNAARQAKLRVFYAIDVISQL